MFAASSTQFDFKPKSVDADLGKCAFLITHAQALPNGYYKICAESLNLQNSGIWTLTSKGTTIYVSSSSEKSFCINTSVLQGIFTLTFEVDGQICFQSYNLPIVDTDCPLFPFGPMGICDGFEVVRVGGDLKNSLFHYPAGAVKGSVHRPFSDPDGLMVHSPWVTSVPDKLCVETYVPEDPGNDQWYDNVSVSNRYAAIVSDTVYADSLTAAEYGHLRQCIYKAIKENPAWLSASVVLDDFYTEEQSSFIGQSIMISDSLEGFEYRVAQQQNILQPYQDSIQALQAEADGLNELLYISADLDSITMILTMLQNIDSCMMQLNHQAEVLSTAFQMYNDTILSQIKTLNNSLSVLSDYEAWEKEMTKLKIKMLMGLAFTSSDSLLVREVASACYKDGGRAVYMARNISNSYLKEYYTDAGCEYAGIEERESGSSSTTAVIWPNPASYKVSISLEESDAAQDAEVRIYNTFGRLVYVQGFDGKAKNKLELSVNELTAGMYFVEIKSGNNSTKAKLIVIH